MSYWPAARTYYIREAISAFNSGLIFTSIWTFYYTVLNLSLVETSYIFVTLTIAGIFFEIPTGVIADVYSRRLSVIIGGACIGLCYTTAALFPVYIVVLISALLEAFGDACVSGALEAWITEEVGPDFVGAVFVRSAQISVPMHWLGVGLSIILAAVFSYQVAIGMGGVLWLLLTLLLVAKMPETVPSAVSPRKHYPIRQQTIDMWNTFLMSLQRVRTNKNILRLVIAGFFATSVFDIFYRFSRFQFLKGFTLPTLVLPGVGLLKDNAWFGLFEVGQGAVAVIGLFILQRCMTMHNAGKVAIVLAVFHTIVIAGLVTFASTSLFMLAIAAWLLIVVLQDLSRPLLASLLNQTIDSRTRATILSINSQGGMFGMLFVSTGVSVLGDIYGIRFALIMTSILLIPTIVVYAHRWRHSNTG